MRLGIALSDGELDTLVGADGTAEHRAFVGIVAGFFDEELGVADAFGRDQDALGVHAVHDIAEALAFLAHQRVGGDFDIVEEYFAGVVVDHGVNLRQRQPVFLGLVHVDKKDRHPVRAFRALIRRRGAGQEQHQIRLKSARGPDLLPVHDIGALVGLFGSRLELRGVAARRGFGHTKGLQAQFARGDLG